MPGTASSVKTSMLDFGPQLAKIVLLVVGFLLVRREAVSGGVLATRLTVVSDDAGGFGRAP